VTLKMPGAPLSADVLQTIRRKSQVRSLSFSRFVFIRSIERCCIIKCPRDDSSLGEQYVLFLNPILTELLQTPYMSPYDYNASNGVMKCVYVM
jgi:hypothetical protein